jgi:hypothetical protein
MLQCGKGSRSHHPIIKEVPVKKIPDMRSGERSIRNIYEQVIGKEVGHEKCGSAGEYAADRGGLLS